MNSRNESTDAEKITQGKKIRVTLEPALERQCALMPSWKRRVLASVYERWARALRVSAAILDADDPLQAARPVLKPLCPAKQEKN